MKFTLSALFFSCVVSFSFAQASFSPGNQEVQKLRLKFTNDLYYSRLPSKNRKRIRFRVTDKLDAINMITSDNQAARRVGKGTRQSLAKGKRAFLLAIPRLYNVSQEGTSFRFDFGQSGGEEGVDDANVQILYDQRELSPVPPSHQSPVMFEVQNDEILEVESSMADAPDISGQEFLKVTGSADAPVTIQIKRDFRQGNVFVCVFDAQNGNLLARLNPKDPVNPSPTQAYTTDRMVYVIPVIRPKVEFQGGKHIIVFEVGDPEKNGSAESEEE